MNGEQPILEVDDLKTYFFTNAGVIKAVDGVSFTISRGQILGIVGESGAGKSMTGFSIIGLVDSPGRVVGGRILFRGKDMVSFSEKDRRHIRGNRIAMIFQDPMMTLNPVLRIDTQMIEALQAHKKITQKTALQHAKDTLYHLGMPAVEERIKAYPHQFSGGMRQRVSIAIALLNKPDLIIADEPTTALDVSIQAQILSEIKKLCRENNTALMWITHDLAVVAGLSDKVCVMYAGKIVEQGDVNDVIDRPLHPYTVGLIDSVPSRNRRGVPLRQIPGMRQPLLNIADKGCLFRERCSRANGDCNESPGMYELLPGHQVRCFHPYLNKAS